MTDSPPSAAVKPVFTLTNGGCIRAMDNADFAVFLENPPPLATGQSWREWLDANAL